MIKSNLNHISSHEQQNVFTIIFIKQTGFYIYIYQMKERYWDFPKLVFMFLLNIVIAKILPTIFHTSDIQILHLNPLTKMISIKQRSCGQNKQNIYCVKICVEPIKNIQKLRYYPQYSTDWEKKIKYLSHRHANQMWEFLCLSRIFGWAILTFTKTINLEKTWNVQFIWLESIVRSKHSKRWWHLVESLN